MALALFTSTQLPLVVAITTVAVDDGHMRSSTAAALVGAGALSTLAGPLHGLRMRRIAARASRRRRGSARASGRSGTTEHRQAHHEVRAAGRLFRLRIWLSSAMWLPVLAANVARGRAGARPAGPRRAPRRRRQPPDRTSAVQAIFGALAGGMITFTGIVFSAVFVAAQIQTSSYSPRLAARLRRDPVVIAGLALPTATATYSLFALAAIGRQTDTVRARLRARRHRALRARRSRCVTLGAFVALVQRAFESTQIGGILRDADAPRLRGDRRRPPARRADRRRARRRRRRADDAVELTHPGPPAVIAAIDRAALLRLADQTGGFVEVAPDGGRVPRRRARSCCASAAAASDPDPALARRVFVLARQRTIDQDPAFALRMLVDIAIRALSPAVNDPTTAVQALDRIEALLVELAPRHPGPSVLVDAGGAPRAIVPAPRWADYVGLGLMEIRRYGDASPQIVRRLHALYDRLCEVVDEGERARVELERRLLRRSRARGVPGRRGARDRRAVRPARARRRAPLGVRGEEARERRRRTRRGARARRGCRGRRRGRGRSPRRGG